MVEVEKVLRNGALEGEGGRRGATAKNSFAEFFFLVLRSLFRSHWGNVDPLRILMFLGLPEPLPDPFFTCTDPDPSTIKQK
jgi:hypothetical protein